MPGGEAVRRSVVDVASESAGTPPTVGGRCTLLVYQRAPGMPDPSGPRDDCPARHGGRHCRGEHRSAAANEQDRESHRRGESHQPKLRGLLAVAAGVGSLWVRSRRLRRETAALGVHLREATADAARWRAEALLRGLGEAVSGQFDRWLLTPAEQEVALLLIKGLSHKEVAQARGTSDGPGASRRSGYTRRPG
jgi:hypothetical protein